MDFKELHVGGIGGLHHELYYPDTDKLFIERLPGEGSTALLSANALFWGLHFRSERVLALAKNLAQCSNGSQPLLPAYRAIAANPELFVNRVEEATLHLCDQSIGNRHFYSYVETLAILCKLYSDMEYHPHILTLYEGFTSFELSSLVLYDQCLTPCANPYLPFIHTYCIPVVLKVKPSLIWLNGRISLPAMTLARLAREICPDVHICVVGHSSEYYSLNKIKKYLVRNEPLFTMIDSIIMDDSEQTRMKLIEALITKKSLSTVSNLMYADRSGEKLQIRHTPFQHHPAYLPLSDITFKRPPTTRIKAGIDPSAIVNIKLFPDHACHWNKCTFCGINQKYHRSLMEEAKWDIQPAVEACKTLASQGVRFIWAIDEAIPAVTLDKLAEGFINNGVNVFWQVRSRFDPVFLEEGICRRLAKSGLKEIRFGLESASSRILKLMKKFPEEVNLGTIKKIVRLFCENGISVHCPVIIGYPTETANEREHTYGFLNELSSKHSKFTFNINIFSLDINSQLFERWYEHGIMSVKFPCDPDHFIGNLLEWECLAPPFDRKQLERERSHVMLRHLYPWMPTSSLTPPHIFYRLCETIRNTLTFQAMPGKEEEVSSPFPHDGPYCLPDHVTLAAPPRFQNCLHQLYNWDTHTWMDIRDGGVKRLKTLNPNSEKIALDKNQPFRYKFFQELYKRGFLIRACMVNNFKR